ncbi:hypothetical protein DBR32_10530 [Taibaiella sp. KBW10]|nr:hypothetical protein DBR32_10530 [Taibaiella sp. KBW10]
MAIYGTTFGQKQAVLDAFSTHGLNPDILDQQSKQNPEGCSYDLKVTTSSSAKDKVVVAHHNAGKTGDERWEVLTVNGKTPGKGAIKTFRKEHGQAIRPTTGLDEATLKIEKQNEKELVVSYKMLPAEIPVEASFLKDCRVYLSIDLATKRLTQLQTLNEVPVKIKIFTAEKFDLTVTYRYDETLKKYFPVSEDLNLLIKLLGQLNRMETLSEYANFTGCL